MHGPMKVRLGKDLQENTRSLLKEGYYPNIEFQSLGKNQ